MNSAEAAEQAVSELSAWTRRHVELRRRLVFWRALLAGCIVALAVALVLAWHRFSQCICP